MRRHPTLRELSVDHHHALVQAHRLVKSAKEIQTARIEAATAFLKFWNAETREHFREEEEVLLPVVARYGGSVTEEPVKTMLVQHAQIRGLVMDLGEGITQGDAAEENLLALGTLLETHVRLEERVVFPYIEGAISETGLAEIQARLKDR